MSSSVANPALSFLPPAVLSEPCCDWVGEDGAGHYVKMVHNGIEYGDMQLICEAYQLMKEGLGMTCDEMSAVSCLVTRKCRLVATDLASRY